ncbi:MAG: CBS domain-containing protein [Gammaproteobacteria bacterium]|nr:CBS domain-containing protein [Gammaproteobacteria bacterium]
MFGKRITLFHILGFAVRLDASWILIAVLLTWSLGQGLFPYYYPDLSAPTHWVMGVAGALGLFVSIIAHELSHSVVARRFGLPITGITLFIFGGVAEMQEEPPNARSELYMAAAGPLASVVIGLLCYGLYATGTSLAWPVTVAGVTGYLAFINIVLAVFNMVPAFPLDGGRVARAALWGWRGDIDWATRIVSRLGSGFGFLLMALGAYQVLLGNLIGGMWWVLIGLFLNGAARGGYEQVKIRRQLEGQRVGRFVSPQPRTVPPDITVETLTERYGLGSEEGPLPVMGEGARLLGCIGPQAVRSLSSADRARRRVEELVEPCGSDQVVSPDTPALRAFSLMQRHRRPRLLVVEDDRLVGEIRLRALLDYLSLQLSPPRPSS